MRLIFRRHPIDSAYVFGSRAHGKAHPESDVDIGVFFKPQRLDKEYAITADLERDLQQIFAPFPVDISVLNRANPTLAYNAIVKGIQVFARREFPSLFTTMMARKKFEDTQHIRDVQLNAMRQQIRTSTFGNP